MRIGILGDIHANTEALTAVVKSMREDGVDVFVQVGDIVGYGPEPSECIDIVRELADFGVCVDVYDPWVSAAEAVHEYGITPVEQPAAGTYDAVVIAVAHREFKAMGIDAIRALGKESHQIFDLKYVFTADETDLRL